MAQRKPELDQPSYKEVLKAARKLSEEEQDNLIEELKRDWLIRALDESEAASARGEVYTAEEVFSELKERNKRFQDKDKR